VFKELGATVDAIGVNPDGFNINLKCGSTSPAELISKVRETGAHLGIAFDGDGDRVLFVDSDGDLVDGDELLYIIASDFMRTRGECAGVVGTLMTNLGMELALRELGIPFARAKVGDRYVLETMIANGWTLGGESSGHIICGHALNTGDGIVSALQVLAAMVGSGQGLKQLLGAVRKLPQTMVNVRVETKPDLGLAAITDAVTAAEQTLGEAGRVLLRPSGTEPVVRVMVEGIDEGLVETLANQIADVVKQASV